MSVEIPGEGEKNGSGALGIAPYVLKKGAIRGLFLSLWSSRRYNFLR